MTGCEWNKLLYDYELCDAYQYISNTRKTLCIALFCKDEILSLISKMEAEHAEWQEKLFGELFSQHEKVKSISVTKSSLPKYSIDACGIETDLPFLLDKLTKDFFQYVRNSFDCMSQAVNAICLSSKAKSIEQVDFRCMQRILTQETYSQLFPSIAAWYERIANSAEFKYIKAFNNRTTHICDVYLKLSMAILCGENESSLNPFYKESVQYERQAVSEYLSSIYDFVSEAYSSLLKELKAEIPKKQLVGSRYHTLKVYQQKFKNTDANGFSIVYIDGVGDITTMPDTIEVLLANEVGGEIIAKNCPVNQIYIKDPKVDNYWGRYIASEPYGDDTLLKYRRYKKQPHIEGTLPLGFQAMTNEENLGIFYHKNPFMDIISNSDDKDFLNRIQIPF